MQREAAGTLETLLMDVTDVDSIGRAARDVALRLDGRGLDGLFNNAGVGTVSPIECERYLKGILQT